MPKNNVSTWESTSNKIFLHHESIIGMQFLYECAGKQIFTFSKCGLMSCQTNRIYTFKFKVLSHSISISSRYIITYSKLLVTYRISISSSRKRLALFLFPITFYSNLCNSLTHNIFRSFFYMPFRHSYLVIVHTGGIDLIRSCRKKHLFTIPRLGILYMCMCFPWINAILVGCFSFCSCISILTWVQKFLEWSNFLQNVT